jgi:hypothetical protein
VNGWSAIAVSPPLVDAVDVFVAGTGAVRAAVGGEAVGAAWDAPSILEGQTVGGLAGHLARTGGWIVGEYLDLGTPDGPIQFADAGDYYARLMDQMDDDAHRAIRDRGAALGAPGQDALVAELDARLAGQEARLAALDEDALVAAYGGQAMRVRDYLVTRVVEQVVHLDDLARSVGAPGWPLPPAGVDLALAVAVDVGRRRRGDAAVLRALYRRGEAEGALPVL